MPGLADLVHETTTSNGTGNLTLAAATGGKRRFSDVFGTGDNGAANPYAFIFHRSLAEWEICPAYMSDADTLVRGTPLLSSNSNAAVNFSAGQKDVVNDLPAALHLMAAQIAAASAKTTPHDDDELGLTDSEASGVLKRLTFANLWAWVIGKIFSTGASAGLTDAATVAISMATRWNFHVTIADDRTLGNPSNVKNDVSGKIEVTASGATRDIALDTGWEDPHAFFNGGAISIPDGETIHIFYYTTRAGVPVVANVVEGM